MSTKSTIIAVVLLAAGLFASHYFTYKTAYSTGYDAAVATLSVDSTAVDTVITKADTVFVIKFRHYVDADVDSISWVDETGQTDSVLFDIVYSTQIDTSVVSGTDTVATLTQNISFSNGYFDIVTDIQIRPVEKLVEVTKTSFRTVLKEVTVSEFPNTWLTGFISGVISFLIMVLLL